MVYRAEPARSSGNPITPVILQSEGYAMLKSALYYYILVVTVLRLADLIYLLGTQTNLPPPVLAAAGAMLLYGIVLSVKRFISSVRLGQLGAFLIAQSLVIGFNIAYVALFVPLRVTLYEMALVGSFLDILVNLWLMRLAFKQKRNRFVSVGDV